MANPYFEFKQFTVWHDKCAMKVGTDGVLLGAWVSINNAGNVLDIGTGTGLIALMITQRSSIPVDAIDIDQAAYLQAKENIERSPFAGRIQVYNQPLSSYADTVNKQYDLIVSNPPYFIESLKSPKQQRNLARHTDSLPLSELVKDSKRLLSPQGRLALILPHDQEEQLINTAMENGLYVVRHTDVIPVVDGTPKRILVELSSTPSAEYTKTKLVIEEARHVYTEEYRSLTKAFYLKM